MESGIYVNNSDVDNAYILISDNKQDIVLVEKDCIYYIEDSNVYKLKLVISAPVVADSIE